MKLYLDDCRDFPIDFDITTRSADVAIALLKTGLITEVSLDHDLGYDLDDDTGELKELPSGQKVADFIEEQAHAGTLKRLTWAVHSDNVVGKERMTRALRNADRFWAEHEKETA